MMNKFLIYISFIAFVLSACNSHSVEQEGAEVSHVVKVGEPKTTATLAIDGMMCEMACGGKIRKELEAIEGVTLASIDFKDERPLNTAMVEYDPSKVDEKKLISTVNQIADGKLYSVKSVEVVQYERKELNRSSAKKTEGDEEVSFDVQRVFKFPDVFHLLEKLIR
jgi:copper chaperone CopZ